MIMLLEQKEVGDHCPCIIVNKLIHFLGYSFIFNLQDVGSSRGGIIDIRISKKKNLLIK